MELSWAKSYLWSLDLEQFPVESNAHPTWDLSRPFKLMMWCSDDVAQCTLKRWAVFGSK